MKAHEQELSDILEEMTSPKMPTSFTLSKGDMKHLETTKLRFLFQHIVERHCNGGIDATLYLFDDGEPRPFVAEERVDKDLILQYRRHFHRTYPDFTKEFLGGPLRPEWIPMVLYMCETQSEQKFIEPMVHKMLTKPKHADEELRVEVRGCTIKIVPAGVILHATIRSTEKPLFERAYQEIKTGVVTTDVSGYKTFGDYATAQRWLDKTIELYLARGK